MIKLLLKLAAILLLIALAVICFIKLLPWCIAVLALLALVKLGHDLAVPPRLPSFGMVAMEKG